MAKLIVYAYGNNNHSSAERLLQYARNFLYRYSDGDRLLVVTGYDAEDRMLNPDKMRQAIETEISDTFNRAHLRIVFSGAGANADVLLLNIHEIDVIYARIYAKIQSLFDTFSVLQDGNACMGDGHPQVIVAMTEVCYQFPRITIFFSHGTQYRTITRLVNTTPVNQPIPKYLPKQIMYNYALAANVYFDLHQFIAQMNTLLEHHEYDAVRTAVMSKYYQSTGNPLIGTILSQWVRLTAGLHAWHNFRHQDALFEFQHLYQICRNAMSTEEQNLLTNNMNRLQIYATQYNMLENIAEFKRNEHIVELRNAIKTYKEWLNAYHLSGYELVIDKYVNAIRCMNENRLDDASVRLSSVLEMIATTRLLLEYEIVTTNMREVEKCQRLGKPAPILMYNNISNISRRDLYNLIQCANQDDVLWQMYINLGGNAPSHRDTPLELLIRQRHKSYLVHGNSVVSDDDCTQFSGHLQTLLETATGNQIDVTQHEIPLFQLAANFNDDGRLALMGWHL
jgi:hypothetical protein